MADLNKAVGIDHYYAIGVRNGVNRFDVAYTSDEAIAVALRNALEDTWETTLKSGIKCMGSMGVNWFCLITRKRTWVNIFGFQFCPLVTQWLYMTLA